ncbi:MAG: beta-lactamase family protein [Actinomycetales bacterium]|nr:beta-lactamase family protein [Actinomycetales bacterium]
MTHLRRRRLAGAVLILPITAAATVAATATAPAGAAAAPGAPDRPTAVASTTAGTATTAVGRPRGDREVQARLDALVAAGGTGVTALVDDGRRVRTATSGLARLTPRTPMRTTNATRVGSITKTFVATVALQLEAEGRLSIDDSVERWLPGVVPGGSGITVRQLLNHTSGIDDYTAVPGWMQQAISDPTRPWRPEELIAVATARPPLFPPGQGWSYSNTNYILAGRIIEAAGGESAERLIDRRIVRPLGLRSTYLAVGHEVPRRQAHGYLPASVATEYGVPLTDGDYTDTTHWTPTWAWTAGAMVSTTDDLSRFYRALFSGRLLPPAQLREMTTTVTVQPGARYGLGIAALDRPCGTVWGHSGGIPGYTSNVVVDRRGRRAAVVLLATDLDENSAAAYEDVVETTTCRIFGRSVTSVGGTGTPEATGRTGLPRDTERLGPRQFLDRLPTPSPSSGR